MTKKNTQGEPPARKSAPPEGGQGTAAYVPAPSVGRVIHYFERDEIVDAASRGREPVPCPGMIRRVRNDAGACDLVIFTDLGVRNVDAAPLADSYPQAGAWTWPPRA